MAPVIAEDEGKGENTRPIVQYQSYQDISCHGVLSSKSNVNLGNNNDSSDSEDSEDEPDFNEVEEGRYAFNNVNASPSTNVIEIPKEILQNPPGENLQCNRQDQCCTQSNYWASSYGTSSKETTNTLYMQQQWGEN